MAFSFAMYVVDILPLAKGVRAESLTYFSGKKIPSGTMVMAPMQTREIRGVVSRCRNAKDMKAELKKMPYEMKEIASVGNQIFFAQYIAACRSFARFSGVTAGSAIRSLTPKTIIDNSDELPRISSDIFLPNITAPQPRIIQTTQQKQYGYINSLIQKQLKERTSVFICTPTNYQVGAVVDNIETDATVIRLDSTLTKNMLLSRWREAVTTRKPVVIVGTAPFLSVPRSDLGLIIVTDEINEAYKMIERPHLDKRLFAKHLAEEYKRDCVLTGSILSIESLWSYRNKSYSGAYKPVFRYESIPTTKLIDMKEIDKKKTSGVKIFSPDVAKEIRKVVGQSRKMILFVARRGQRPFTICNDCGNTVVCKRCSYPLVLEEDNDGKRSFECRNCKTVETSFQRCHNCHSWKLEALGVGIDFVANILKENIPEVSVFQTDGKNTSTEKKILKKMEDFREADSGILLTTQLGINRLRVKVDTSAVITADSLLALPDISISEKLFSLLLDIREHTKESMLIQTRAKHTAIYEQALAGDVTSFYRDQIALREQFGYPPFSYLIKLSSSGKKATVKKHMKDIKRLFSDEILSIYPQSSGTGFGAHALMKIDQERWVDESILQKLYSLPLGVDIDAHPKSLL